MNKTTAQLTDTVFANSAALDAVLGSVDLDAATSFDDLIGPLDESLATHTATTSRRMKPDRTNQKRRLPWLGL